MINSEEIIENTKAASLDSLNLKAHLQANIDWFINSGVMDPAHGTWGVAERVVLTENNSALEMIYRAFPYYTENYNYTIMEHRRADCNFQTALLFNLSSQAFNNPEYKNICENILNYLFNRSGMKCVPYEPENEEIPAGIWNWSTPKWRPTIYLDDNAWNCVCCLMLSGDKDFQQKFPLKESGLNIADIFVDQLNIILSHNKESLCKETFWSGEPDSPHWGGLVAMSLCYAYAFSHKQKYLDAAYSYFDFLENIADGFTTSEQAYMLLSTSAAAGLVESSKLLQTAVKWADIVIAQMHSDASIASQWRETPEGFNFVDTVYTQNWATLGLQNIKKLVDTKIYSNAFARSLHLLLKIQDYSPEKYLNGCWRGLYDMQQGAWGGGDKYEGGANSIYTGWTNAPIAWTIAMEILGITMFEKNNV